MLPTELTESLEIPDYLLPNRASFFHVDATHDPVTDAIQRTYTRSTGVKNEPASFQPGGGGGLLQMDQRQMQTSYSIFLRKNPKAQIGDGVRDENDRFFLVDHVYSPGELTEVFWVVQATLQRTGS